MNLKIVICVALAVVLQSSLPAVSTSTAYVDLPLIVVVYFALQRNTVQAIFIGAIAGLATDALASGGILGANGFTKTLVAYLIAMLAIRIRLDSILARIPVLAGAVAVDNLIYTGLHRLLGQPSFAPFANTLAYKLIATTVAGTLLFLIFDRVIGEHSQARRQFALRRRVAMRRFGLRRR